MAVVNEEATVFKRLIVSIDDLLATATLLCKEFPIDSVIVGDKTNSQQVRQTLAVLGLPLRTIDEHNSSREGRNRFLKDHTSGLARLIPIGLRVPDRPFDDYVAVVLAERFFRLRSQDLPVHFE